MSDCYTLYYMDLSYYSGKVQSYLHYKEIPLREQHIDWWMMAHRILPNTGMMEVPVVQTPEGEWLRDSTSMIFWFEDKFKNSSVIPEDPYQAFFNYLLEDYADEWLWRPAMHYRWSYAKDRRLNERRFTEDFMLHPPGTRLITRLYLGWRQKQTYIKEDGVSKETWDHVENTYLDTLDRMEAILKKRPFLFGDKPSIADFGFMASMYRHFGIDPTPARLMRERAPAVYAWVGRMWSARQSKLNDKPWAAAPGTLPEDWSPLLEHMGKTYLPYLAANAEAYKNGQSHFDLTIEGFSYKQLPVSPYRVWSMGKLMDYYKALPDKVRGAVQKTLVEHQCREHLWAHRDCQAEIRDGDTLPHCSPFPLSFWQRLLYYATGTPRHTDLIKKSA